MYKTIIATSIATCSVLYATHKSTIIKTLQQQPTITTTTIPQHYTELAVEMHCDECVNTVHNILKQIQGIDINSININLSEQSVKLKSTKRGEEIALILNNNGKKACIIGLSGENFTLPSEIGEIGENTSVVGEFKGSLYGHGSILGIVRIVQLAEKETLSTFTLSGLQPETLYTIAVHKYGDQTKGVQSAGPLYPNGTLIESKQSTINGEINGESIVKGLNVWELIGRSILLSTTLNGEGIASTIVARSAGVGVNPKRLCTCDGTVIWEAN